ncbi:hypothetical protein [Afipia sp. Root123D2]|uniref:hypothetical protein n=1 Tax=Afipia sp. Root123D2 TaxID=1736436 RepID=UPI00138F4AF3|nr:hypothetical protein [Afipia sp. Root123D2]
MRQTSRFAGLPHGLRHDADDACLIFHADERAAMMTFGLRTLSLIYDLLCRHFQQVREQSMPKLILDCRAISLSHDQMVNLRKSGHLNLGIDNSLAAQISAERLGSKTTTASEAHKFWRLAALGVAAYGIYLSFTSHWWWFIVGIIGALIISKANQKGNAGNVLDAAMIDPDFYERVRKINGWQYQIDEANAAQYRLSTGQNAKSQPAQEARIIPQSEVDRLRENIPQILDTYTNLIIKHSGEIIDSSWLPVSKEQMIEIFKSMWVNAETEDHRDAVESLWSSLSFFQEGVGSTPITPPIENVKDMPIEKMSEALGKYLPWSDRVSSDMLAIRREREAFKKENAPRH